MPAPRAYHAAVWSVTALLAEWSHGLLLRVAAARAGVAGFSDPSSPHGCPLWLRPEAFAGAMGPVFTVPNFASQRLLFSSNVTLS